MADSGIKRGIREVSPGRDRRGQTLLEAIIAIGIIVTAVSSSLTLVQGAITAEGQSEASIVAGNLAREGVEVVRALRDGNWLADVAWDAGLEGTGADYTAMPVFAPATAAWTLNFTPDTIDSGGAVIYRYPATTGSAAEGLHVQAASIPIDTQDSGFRRLLFLDPICDDGSVVTSGSTCGVAKKIGIRVTSQVAWETQGGASHSTSVIEELYDWR